MLINKFGPAQGKFGVLILAAGGSTRLGKPKQLLPYLGKTLVEHAVATALASCADEVTVVVGAEECAVREKLADLPVRIVSNADWAEGMGSSIRCGVGALMSETACVVIMLCDQPHVTSALIRDLVDRHFKTGAPIVASSYDGVKGAPSAFGASLFQDLKSLKGDAGARDLIRKSPVPVESVPFDGGNLDVDVEEDIRRLNEGK
jgi:molybdenum cofactor cytidylyltransferase